jgi:SAM-dependent methyltransferase
MNSSHITFLSSPEWARMLEADLVPWIDSSGDLGDDVLEIGPGPGLTTDLLRARVARVTAVEVDHELATALAERLAGTNVVVLAGDGTETGLETDRFSGAVCFSVLHHLPTADAQDRLLTEMARVLRPGAILMGVDALDTDAIRVAHHGDVFTPIAPDTLAERLRAAGLRQIRLDRQDYQFRFVATVPSS